MLGMSQFNTFITSYTDRLAGLVQLLNDLDNRIGDGDHGTNMARGFQAAVQKLKDSPATDLGSACQAIAMTLLGTVGGASGPLYSTVFLRLATSWRGYTTVEGHQIRTALQSALEGLKARGHADVGEKTMVDVWQPVVQHLHNSHMVTADLLRQAAAVAQQSALSTKDMVAAKGRAAYLGDRSKGTCDPGSVSSAVFFEEFMDAVAGGVERIAWLTQAL